MQTNEILKLMGIVFLLCLSFFLMSSSVYILNKTFSHDIKHVNVHLDSDYIADQVSEALLDTNVASDLEEIKQASN
jgi:hypothetical protein